MGHRKYPAVAYRDCALTRGYLYAIPTGLWPAADGTLKLRIKLGSTRSPDPVATCKNRYNTSLGRTEILWLEASANAYRDECDVLHSHFSGRRVFPDRELFEYRDEEEFRQEIVAFTLQFRRATIAEVPYKAAAVLDLKTPIGKAAKPAIHARKSAVALLRSEQRALREARRAVELQRAEAEVQREQARLESEERRLSRVTEEPDEASAVSSWCSDRIEAREGGWLTVRAAFDDFQITRSRLGKNRFSARLKMILGVHSFEPNKKLKGKMCAAFWGFALKDQS